MSLALIQESAKEVRRLAIAGSPLAVGDFRLKKLAAPLEQAGAKVPVFAQVAKAIGDLVEGDEARSAERLLALSTLLNAILYTQGQTGIEGAVEDLATTPVTGSVTRTPARVLRPLQEALTRTGGGRFEVVKSAVDAGAFHDLRLVDPAIQALGDAYPELADLVAEKVLPGFGPGIASRLKDGLDLKGKKQDARRLEVLHRVDPATALPLCKAALEDGAPDVKAAAIICLGEHEDCLPLVLEQAKAKNKQVRAAALEALAKHDRPEVTKLFGELIQGDALGLLAGPFRALRNKQVLKSLLDEGQKVFDLLLKDEGEQVARFLEILDCLKERKDAETEEFILAQFAQCERLPKFKAPKKSQFVVFTTGEDIVDRMVWLLYEIGTPKAFEAVLAKRETLPPSSFQHVLYSALRAWPADKVFAEFSVLLEQKKGAGKEKAEILERTIYASNRELGPSFLGRFVSEVEESEESVAVTWDSRWLDSAIQSDRPEAVCYLARPGHKGAVVYLLKQVESENKLRPGLAIEALARCRYPKVTDVFLALMAKHTKSAKRWDFDLQQLLAHARFLPAADLPKLEAFAATLDEKFMEPFLEALAPLRSTAPTD